MRRLGPLLVLWLPSRSRFDVHRRDCCHLSVTVGRLAFRWPRQ